MTKDQAMERAGAISTNYRVKLDIAAAVLRAHNEAVEAALQKIPGGQMCDPQEVADAIRALKVPT